MPTTLSSVNGLEYSAATVRFLANVPLCLLGPIFCDISISTENV